MVYTDKRMKVIFGLGNPEQRYTGTRHNIGFWALNKLASKWNVLFKQENKFSAQVATITIDGEKVLLVQPQTYYNDVGQCARAILDFYKLEPADFLIIHDDLALPLGTIRTRVGGSSGGNNGLKSTEAHIGTETARLRVGVWTEQHTAVDKVAVVLSKLSQPERHILEDGLSTIEKMARSFVAGDFTVTTHKLPNKLDAE